MKHFVKKLSTLHSQLSIQRGFTLIELLVAIGLFSALATVIISVLFISFRTSKKSDTIISLRESGNSALLQMVNNIRFARSLDDPLTCIPDATGNFVTASSITVTALDGGQTVYSCPGVTNDSGVTTETISSNSAALLDVNSVAVNSNSCSFTCSQATTADPPTITVKFTLSAASSTDFAGNATSLPFQSTITMRNYSK